MYLLLATNLVQWVVVVYNHKIDMAILKIITVPNQILNIRAEEVDAVDDSIRKLMDDMLETMYAGDGVGLGANQVASLKRVIVIDLQNDDDTERSDSFYPLKIANPVIVHKSDNIIEAKEYCLSVPGIGVPVKRPDFITIEYLDYNNEKQTLSTGGWLARAIQHEIDHIDGKTLINYLSPLKRDVAIRKVKKYVKPAA